MGCNNIIKHAIEQLLSCSGGKSAPTIALEFDGSPLLRALSEFSTMSDDWVQSTVRMVGNMNRSEVRSSVLTMLATQPEPSYILNSFALMARLQDSTPLSYYKQFSKHFEDMPDEKRDAYLVGFASLANEFPGNPHAQSVLDDVLAQAKAYGSPATRSIVAGMNDDEYHRVLKKAEQKEDPKFKGLDVGYDFMIGATMRDEPVAPSLRDTIHQHLHQNPSDKMLYPHLMKTRTPNTTAILKSFVDKGDYSLMNVDTPQQIVRELYGRGEDVTAAADVITNDRMSIYANNPGFASHTSEGELTMIAQCASPAARMNAFRTLRDQYFSNLSVLHGQQGKEQSPTQITMGSQMEQKFYRYVQLLAEIKNDPEVLDELTSIARHTEIPYIMRTAVKTLKTTQGGRESLQKIIQDPDPTPTDKYAHRRAYNRKWITENMGTPKES